MDEKESWAQQFEKNRGHLRAVAYRMLGSLNEADDGVQEAWLRLSRSDATAIENLGGWLTTVVARVCLDILRSRASRREETLEAQEFEPAAKRRRASDPSRKFCWPTRSVSRYSWCSTASRPPSASHLCCTTCSPCPSTKSHHWPLPNYGEAAGKPGPPPCAGSGQGSRLLSFRTTRSRQRFPYRFACR
jgi:hypothetical protein